MLAPRTSQRPWSPLLPPVRWQVLLPLLLLLLGFAFISVAQQTTPSTTGDGQMLKDLAATLAAEQERLDNLESAWSDFQANLSARQADIQAYKMRLSAARVLLLNPDSPVANLERSRSEHLQTMERLNDLLKQLRRERETHRESLRQAHQQLALNAKQLDDQALDGQVDPAFANDSKSLEALITSRIRRLGDVDNYFTTLIQPLESVLGDLTLLTATFEETLNTRQRQVLFERSAHPGLAAKWQLLQTDVGLLGRLARDLFTGGLLVSVGRALGAGGLPVGYSLLLLALVVAGARRLRRRSLLWLSGRPDGEIIPWCHLTQALVCRSLPLLGSLGLTFLFFNQGVTANFGLDLAARLLLFLLLGWQVTRWRLDLIDLWPQTLPAQVSGRIKRLLWLLRGFIALYLLLRLAVGEGSVLLDLARLTLDIYLLGWCLGFWRAVGRTAAGSTGPGRRFSRALSYLICVGALLLELGGFGTLALFWMRSWGRTAAVLVWAFLIARCLGELERRHRSAPGDASVSVLSTGPLRWLAFRLGWLAWALPLLIALAGSWGVPPGTMLSMARWLNSQFSVGGIHLNPVGIALGLLLLLLTHTGARLWRESLSERLLHSRRLDPGLKNSATIITLYLIWLFGILIALNMAGINMTSLTVVFGALSIGLGFGLQNIFNNFISGLILLFERPIQVGDSIEINGIWGEIKKINVRATHVQTFDNASLIIPNSDFISSQVTNWTFKDQRLRRKIMVGVAYGSDVELVRETLLEAASQTENVLKSPAPDVHFLEFGDSSLNFMLRYWTTFNYYYTTSTPIMFTIDRLFRQRDITIPFPQRDLHLRSVDVPLSPGLDGDSAAR